MKKNQKTLIVVGIIIILIIAAIFIYNNKNITDTSSVKDGEATSDVAVEDIVFSNIKLDYTGGITNVSANAVNNTSETKTVKIQISLIDEDGKEVTNVMQILEDLKAKEKATVAAGVTGDYSNIKEVKFKVVK